MDLQRLERVRLAAGIVAAVITGGAGLYGVYRKAREATAASYETLAPEINKLKEAVHALEEDNAALRTGLLPRTARTPAGTHAREDTTQGRAAPRRPRPSAPPVTDGGVAAPSAAPAGSPPAPSPAPAPEGKPGDRPPPAIEEAAREATKRATEKVPIDFEKAAEIWRDMKELRRKRQEQR